MALDDTCYGMYGTLKQRSNPETTVCINGQIFFHVSAQDDWDWGARATNKFHIDGVCGLGKEKASETSQGMIARAVQAGDLKSNAYSIRLVPQTLALPVARDPNIPSNRTPEQILQTSFLTLGGWDTEDYKGDVAWFSTGDGWNQTLTSLTYDGETIVDEYDVAPVMFETGYPYIGMTQAYFDKFSALVKRNNPGMDCAAGSHWGICRVPKTRCEQLKLGQDFKITMGDYDFTLPLENIAIYVNQSDSYYCQTQVALLAASSDNAIVLGSAFFTAFVGIFDTENERIGLAQSINTLPGSSIKCNKGDCSSSGSVLPDPED